MKQGSNTSIRSLINSQLKGLHTKKRAQNGTVIRFRYKYLSHFKQVCVLSTCTNLFSIIRHEKIILNHSHINN